MKGVAVPQFALGALNSTAVTKVGMHGVGVKGMATPQLAFLDLDSTAVTEAGTHGFNNVKKKLFVPSKWP